MNIDVIKMCTQGPTFDASPDKNHRSQRVIGLKCEQVHREVIKSMDLLHRFC